MKSPKFQILICFLLCIHFIPASAYGQKNTLRVSRDIERLLQLFDQNKPKIVEKNLEYFKNNWKKEYTAPLIEVLNYARDPVTNRKILKLLRSKTGVNKGRNVQAWYKWLWNQPEHKLNDYGDFKAGLYGQLDPKFTKYFHNRTDETAIRMDEIRWGGVKQDGIPPLRNPKMIPADKANYLNDSDTIFGIDVNGDVRAYPMRILGWHELFTDKVGGMPVAGVYCPLCGTVILYETNYKGRKFMLGTSGFLYRSNKLMYDKKTQSLWSTLRGKPVVGPLVNKGIKLKYMSVVTTTWKDWKNRHPNTKVLSLDTGYQRNYGSGQAYKKYLSTDKLMFQVPFNDHRLKNKAQVLALKAPGFHGKKLAIAVKFLNEHPIYTDMVGDVKFVVFTDPSGANRVYITHGTVFKSYDGDKTATDNNGNKWTLKESKLVSENGEILQRLPTFRSFWFGWHAAYPNTELVKL